MVVAHNVQSESSPESQLAITDRANVLQFPLQQPYDEASSIHVAQGFEEVKRLTSFRSVRLLSTAKVDEGVITTYGLVDAAGYARAGVVSMPHQDLQTTNIPAIATAAWLTSNRGHNEHTQRKFMEAGVPMILEGAEGSYRPPIWQMRPPKAGINLANSAGSLLTFSNWIVGDIYPELLNPFQREVIGESRGAMVGMGVVAFAAYFDQEVVLADLTAPCFPEKLSRQNAWELKNQLLSEPKTVGKLAGKLALKLLMHYPSTIDVHPYAVMHQIGILPALVSGEAGDLAELINDQPIVHVTCFDEDLASMSDGWVSRFKHNPNSRVTPLEGSHLTIADPQTLQFVLARNYAYQQLTASHGKGNFSGDDVFDLSHAVASQFATAS